MNCKKCGKYRRAPITCTSKVRTVDNPDLTTITKISILFFDIGLDVVNHRLVNFARDLNEGLALHLIKLDSNSTF